VQQVTASINHCDAAGICNSSFDLQAVIAELLSDSGCYSVELPSGLTPAERKLAKSIADQYPELKCESYGFGPDRRCHLFKRSATTCIRLTNTFIEGWSGIENDEEPVISRSMPAELDIIPTKARADSGCNGMIELPPLSPTAHDTACGPQCGLLPTAQDIDIDEISESTNAETMFEPTSPYSDVSSLGVPPGIFRFPVGTCVLIQGLVKFPAFNGQIGVVHALDEATGRYDVMLASPAAGRQWAKVKYENLRPANRTRQPL